MMTSCSRCVSPFILKRTYVFSVRHALIPSLPRHLFQNKDSTGTPSLATYSSVGHGNTATDTSRSSKPTPSSSLQSSPTSAFDNRPGPIPLGNKAHQAEFEKLQQDFLTRQTGAESTPETRHPDAPKEVLVGFQDGKNPSTGEVNGPKGPEPTRYGDWERKGIVSDF